MSDRLEKVIVVQFDGVNPYTHFRKDGWPLCPGCGQDELWGLPEIKRAEGEKQAWIIQACYACHWRPEQTEAARL